jgi:peptide/nickel transport system substrate-binding protein
LLREGFDYDLSRVDPAAGAHVDPPWCAIYETALVFDRDSRPGPMLVDGWRVDDDLLAWRLHVRDGARFHSGRSCDAAAVAAAFDVHRDPIQSPVNQFFWEPVRDVTVEGGEVVIHLRHPYAGLPTLLRSWHSAIHDQEARALLGSAYGWSDASGTGPFRFASLVPGERMDVVRSDRYKGNGVGWVSNQGPAYLDGIRWIPLLDEESRAAALEDNLVDCLQNPSLLHVDRLAANPNLRVIEYQQSALAYLALDQQTTEFGFHDVRVRRAFSWAIDRTRIVDQDLGGHGWAAYGPIPSASPWYYPAVETMARFDLEEAGRLLDEAGFPAGPGGIRMTVPTLVVEDATLHRVVSSLTGMLARIGVRLEVERIAGFAAFYAAVGAHPPAFISKWLWPDPVDALIGFVNSGSHTGPNWQRAAIPVIDEACDEWRTAPDATAQRSAAQRLQRACAEHLPLIPLYFPSAVWAHHRSVRGWEPFGANLYPLYNDVWIERGATSG